MKQLALLLSLTCFVYSAHAEDAVVKPETPITTASKSFIGPIPASGNITSKIPGSELPQLSVLTQKTFCTLGALTLLLLLATGTAKRFSGKRGLALNAPEINVLSRKAVGSRQALLLVAVGDQKFLLSQGSEQLQLISEIDDGNSFRQVFGETFEEPDTSVAPRAALGGSK